MVLPFETSSPEDRRVERERQRRLVFALPRAEPTADCLSSMASNLLDHQFRLEDSVLAAAADAPPAPERLVILLASLRAVLPEATAMFGQSYAATHYGCHAVGNALHVDEDVPGLTAAQMKAIRAASVAEEQARAARAAQPVAARNNTAGCRHSIQLASARATAAAMEAAPEPEPPAPAVPAGPTAGHGLSFDWIARPPSSYCEPNNKSALSHLPQLRKTVSEWETGGFIERLQSPAFCCNPMTVAVQHNLVTDVIKYRPCQSWARVPAGPSRDACPSSFISSSRSAFARAFSKFFFRV